MKEFQDCLEVCGLHDLRFVGFEFTWSNKQAGEANILERLDRAMACSRLMDIYPRSRSRI
ncbi:hypothetical protein ACS0TY_026348 [Phlomoides rotata]